MMDSNILCILLAQRISPEHFQVHGEKVVFFDPDKNSKPAGSPNESPYDTPENWAVVEDVIANYDTLASAYLASEAVKKADEEIQTNLKEIDLKSIRSLREWVVAQPDAPTYIKDFEIKAADERIKLK
jgi:hypothetical protein